MGIRMENNRFNKNHACLLMLFLIALFSADSAAQISFETYMENYYDDNIYNNSYKVEDFINSFSLNSGYNFESDFNNLQFYYIYCFPF